MYTPPAFAEDDPAIIAAIMRACRLPVLVSAGEAGLEATHLPLLHFPDPAPHGTLVGHLARANRQWHVLRDGAPAMAIFQAHDFYVSPGWYATKRETGRVVPTWNYEAVHLQGAVEIIEDPIRLRDIVTALTDREEAPQPNPWHVDDAPEDFIAAQLKGIVGVVMTVRSVIAKRKLSQNRPPADRAGVIAALAASGRAEEAAIMHEREAAADRPGPEPSPRSRG
ncbi:FMN-binding negative transcriptional regulator [Acidiphilium sp.]|uniref:FMN-binding negative transcriptional regulator n=1 Tax=Acidiphilium sp. TaxID=527 RepID=UPI002584F033|nr:FMN-binding negative transcriptional regulator [Acidiphilium sp.]